MRNEKQLMETLPLLEKDISKLTRSEAIQAGKKIVSSLSELMKSGLERGIFVSSLETVFQEVYSDKSNSENTYYTMVGIAFITGLIETLKLKYEDSGKLQKVIEKIAEYDDALGLLGMTIPIAVRIAGTIKPGEWGNSVGDNIKFLSSAIIPSLLAGLLRFPQFKKFMDKNFYNQSSLLKRLAVGGYEFVIDFVNSYQLLEIALFFVNAINREFLIKYEDEIGIAHMAAALANTIATQLIFIKHPQTREKYQRLVTIGSIVGLGFSALSNVISMAKQDSDQEEGRTDRVMIATIVSGIAAVGICGFAWWKASHKKSMPTSIKYPLDISAEPSDQNQDKKLKQKESKEEITYSINIGKETITEVKKISWMNSSWFYSFFGSAKSLSPDAQRFEDKENENHENPNQRQEILVK